jgi:hypothetical protein
MSALKHELQDNELICGSFDALTAVMVKMLVFWDVMP